MKYSEATVSAHVDLKEWSTVARVIEAIGRTLRGNLVGKRVLDLGCGDGTLVRQMIAQGATHATGVDISPAMLAAANSKTDDPRVRFIQGDLVKLRDLGEKFDLVTSEFAICHAKNIAELECMLKGAFVHVAPAGLFVAATCDPPQGTGAAQRNASFARQYGVSFQGYSGDLRDGDSVTTVFSPPGIKPEAVTDFYYSPDTIVAIMRKIGFVDVTTCAPTTCPQELSAIQGELADFLANPVTFLITGSAPA